MRILLTARGEWNIHAIGVLANQLLREGCEVYVAHEPFSADTSLPFSPSWDGPVLPMSPEQVATSVLPQHVDAIGVFGQPNAVSQVCEVIRLTNAMAGQPGVPIFSGPVEPLSGDLLEVDLLGRLGCDLLCLHGSEEQEVIDELTCRRPQQPRQRTVEMGWWQIPQTPQSVRTVAGGRKNQSLVFVEQRDYPSSVTGKRRLLQELEQLCRKLPSWKIIVQPDYVQPKEPKKLSSHSLARMMLTEDLLPCLELPANLMLGSTGGLPQILANATLTATLTSTQALPALVHDRPILVVADHGFSSLANSGLWMGSGLLHFLKDIGGEDEVQPLAPVNQGWMESMGGSIRDGASRLLASLQELTGAQ